LSVVDVVVHFINKHYENVTRLIGLPELPGHSKAGIDQAIVILLLLTHFGITNANLGYFVLDNTKNNDTTLEALAETIGFDPEEKRLRYISHILNLIAKAYLFRQDTKSFTKEYKEAGPPKRRKIWRRRGELGKLHNLVAYVMASRNKQSSLCHFKDLLT
jgi:hypothetical protein